ncbi:MAG: hypothetical protein MUF81_06420 [Verrucomicrobia bacterium]|jgi:hypothetical protein|nr:hypothetical protein [Verrucomicrobiota bacterium]
MKTALVIAIVIAVGIVAGFLFLRSRVAESGTLAELPLRLAKLRQQDRDPKAFFGFCTRDEDALYFVHEDGAFYLDYELTTPAKRGHADAFRKAAVEFGFSVMDKSYNGQFPVLRVKAGDTDEQAAIVALKFTQRLFGHNQNTVFEFLP